MTFNSLIESYARKRPTFQFLQVGGYDGVSYDPIRRFITEFSWKGIIIEPNPEPFKRLQNLYAGSNSILCLNIAIAPKRGTMPFFFVPASETGVEWAPSIGTLAPNRGRINEFNANTRSVPVSCFPLSDVVVEHSVDHLDLLQIDVEGYDFEVIRSLDLQRIKPTIIHWEDRHLPEEEQRECVRHLEANGYAVFQERHPNDSTAYLPDAIA